MDDSKAGGARLSGRRDAEEPREKGAEDGKDRSDGADASGGMPVSEDFELDRAETEAKDEDVQEGLPALEQVPWTFPVPAGSSCAVAIAELRHSHVTRMASGACTTQVLRFRRPILRVLQRRSALPSHLP